MKTDELMVIKQAIVNEIEGYEFYKMAEKQADSEETKLALGHLSEEELTHIGYLKTLFNKMQEEDDAFSLAFLENPPSPGIYDWEKHHFAEKSIAVSIYGTAVNLEKASVEFYKEAREKSHHEAARKLYEMLINWEQVHLEQFSKAYKISMESWWDEQGFAPF
ncbi:MAG: ferritin family protein [Tissierellales bacterium]|nr:ferritin family protein [Tissierellales bacterium]MBN2827093.1 ferritin family protein [Tissierellales bacterium]